MARRLPSLNALRAFETAARYQSFKAAADELFVTHAAISRHIRDLEDWLGVELFVRTGRGVKLTEAGARYGRVLTPLFDQMAQETRDIMSAGKARTLNVSVEPATASRWLVPRLGRFNALYPDIELNINPDTRLVDFRAGEFELGIRYGIGPWENAEVVKLSESVSFPVCSPTLIKDWPGITPADLSNFILLHEQRKQWWTDWLSVAGVAGSENWRGTVFQGHLAIEAAEAGQGFALGDQILCTDSMIEGWLARPFDLDLKDHGAYWIARAKGMKETAPARAFREWLISEMIETNRKFAQIKAAKSARPSLDTKPALVTRQNP